jgi:hypothetical protein
VDKTRKNPETNTVTNLVKRLKYKTKLAILEKRARETKTGQKDL